MLWFPNGLYRKYILNQCEKSSQEDMIITFQHFLLAVSHDVDVLDADELEFNVGVVVFVFVAFSCSSVCDCIQLERHLYHQNIELDP